MSLFSRVEENLCAVHFDDIGIGASNNTLVNSELSVSNVTNSVGE